MTKPRKSEIAFSPAVKAAREVLGSRAMVQRFSDKRDFHTTITSDLAAFLAQRDSFFLATASADGQP